MAKVHTKDELCGAKKSLTEPPSPVVGQFYTHAGYPKDVRMCVSYDSTVIMIDVKTGRRVAGAGSCKTEVANGAYVIAPHIFIVVDEEG